MEALLVDVGQGSCQVILTGDRTAIVVDAGRRAEEVLRVLGRYRIDRLARLVVSHLDADHARGAVALLDEYQGRIDQVRFPNDHRVRSSPFFRRAVELVRAGHLTPAQLIRLELPSSRDKVIWQDRPAEARLVLVSPTFADNQLAVAAAAADATSGIMVLEVGRRRVVFAGDSTLDQWRAYRGRRTGPLTCDVFAVPHHAGVMWPAGLAAADIGRELDWLYTEAVRADLAVVSVGTRNQYRHPRPEVIAAVRRHGATVACTQIGRQCCGRLEQVRSDNLPLGLPGRAKDQPDQPHGKSRNVACAGTVFVEIGPDSLRVPGLNRHQAFVERVRSTHGGDPLCRR